MWLVVGFFFLNNSGVGVFDIARLLCTGGSSLGPAGPCVGEEVSGSDAGLLHHPLLLRRP